MIFVDTHRLSPVAKKEDLPWEDDLFHYSPGEIPTGKKDFQEFIKDNNIHTDKAWWEKQKQRCLNGFDIPDAIAEGGDYFVDDKDAIWYDDGSVYLPEYKTWIKNRTLHISGRFYFYLNFWNIYGLNDNSNVKTIINPKFLDIDYAFFLRIKRMFQEDKDNSELKGRQQGFSEKAGGGILGFNYSFVPNSVNLIVSGLETDAQHTFENAERGLSSLRNTQFYKNRSIDKKSDLIIKAKHFGSEIRGLTAKDKPQVVSRYSPYWIIWEEVGKWPKGLCLETREFALSAQFAEVKKTGYNTYIGTGGDMDLGADDLKEIHYNPEAYNVLEFSNKWERDANSINYKSGHFSTAVAYKIIDKDGNSNLKEGEKYLQEQIAKKKNQKEKLKYTTQNPKYASDAFLISTGGFFGEDKILMLNKRYTEILGGYVSAPIEVGYLEPKDSSNLGKGVKFVPSDRGWIKILEHPRKDKEGNIYLNLYVQGTDSYDIDETNTTDSKGASYIKKKFLPGDAIYNNYVAELISRPDQKSGGARSFYKKCALLSIYYNCQNLIENRNLRIFDWYDNNKLGSFIKGRPELALATMGNSVKSQSMQRRGIDPALKPHFLGLLADNLTDEFIAKLEFDTQVQALAKYRYETGNHKYNCDITIATSICELSQKEDEFLPVIGSNDMEKRLDFKTSKFVNRGGKIVRVYA